MDFTASRCPGKADPVNQKAKKVLLAKRRREEVLGEKSLCWTLSVFLWIPMVTFFFFFAFIFLLLLIFFVHLFVSVLSVCLRFVRMF